MEIIDLPIHLPTAIGASAVFAIAWLTSVIMRRRKSKPRASPESKAKRRYTRKRPEQNEPVAQ